MLMRTLPWSGKSSIGMGSVCLLHLHYDYRTVATLGQMCGGASCSLRLMFAEAATGSVHERASGGTGQVFCWDARRSW